MFDITKIPFSRYGSFLTISPFADSQNRKELYVRSVRGGDFDTGYGRIFKMEVIDLMGAVLSYQIEMEETELKLVTQTGKVSFCIEDQSKLRMYGEGVGLRLTMQASRYDYAIPFVADRYQINYAKNDLKFVMTPLEGRLNVTAPWKVDHSNDIAIELWPDQETRNFHGVLEEFKTVCKFIEYEQSYQKCLDKVHTEYVNWKEKVLHTPENFQSGRDLASYITWSCVVPKGGQLSRDAMYMSKNWMTNIWSWDHCFNAIALIKHQPELAWDQFMIFFDLQDESGVLPDFANDVFAYYSFTKPPIHGWTLSYMMHENPSFFDPERLEEVFEPLEKWTHYWFTYTDYYGEGIPAYNHGNDAGWDNSTIFHLGPPIQSPDLLSFLILQMKTLSEVAEKLGLIEKQHYWQGRADQTLARLLEVFWNGKSFVPKKRGFSEADFVGDSLIMFVPIILGELLPQEIREQLIHGLTKENRFLTEYGLATESVTSEFYKDDGYWRGPIWAPSTMLIVDGLDRTGRKDLAGDIARRFVNMANQSGMAENFNATTGDGLRDPAFTWTSSVFLILADRYYG